MTTTDLSDIVFNAWIGIDYVDLPDRIEDMPAHMALMYEQMRKKAPQLHALTDWELCDIIDSF
jgi:hypothetical protein